MKPKHNDPFTRQKYTNPVKSIDSFIGRFVTTTVVLICACFGLAYLIGVGALDLGGLALTLLFVLAITIILIGLAASALSTSR